ncbi:MAG: hypothetical protein AAF636_01245 [Pseudomonadota bacterium]
MNKRAVTVQLSSDLLLAVHDLATEQEGTVAKVVEGALLEHIASRKGTLKSAPQASDKLVFALQKLLFRDMAEATGWADLDARLRGHGYYIKLAMGGMSLHTETSGQKLCSLKDLGFSYATFLRRFGQGRPKDPREE